MTIPLARPCIEEEEIEAVVQVLRSGWLGIGPVTRQFEEALQNMLGCSHVIAVSTGTAALHLALLSLGIAEGDEVLVPSMTFCASIQAIIAVGAIPIFVDVNPDTLCIDVTDLWRRITKKAKAIMPVHYGGQPCNMDSIVNIAQHHSLVIVEDAAHAFGSNYQGRQIGTIGDATCFSFDPIKNITCGEGGAISVREEHVAEKIRRLRLLGIGQDTSSQSKGFRKTYQVVDAGYRYHMSDINAAIGLQQLARFSELAKRRREIWQRYTQLLKKCPHIQVLHHDLQECVPFHYVLRVTNGQRDVLLASLCAHQIEAGIHYPPNHLQPFFAPYTTSLPLTELIATQILTLPLYPQMCDDDINFVVDILKSSIEE